MKVPRAWLLCLLLLGLTLQVAARRTHQHTMETHGTNINPAWYRGHGIRPVGRFGRRRAALAVVPKPGQQPQLACFNLEGIAKSSQEG
ncbi:prolactin-releasing peptide [Nycticebus coucang]|uniref:prolactin-releasing peptide n=1 Tax=Nycticebus coucang TaxID=9470 RepID=UPI00234D22FF|nr:prolactin-releasing peptide [Nycticebus coucang]